MENGAEDKTLKKSENNVADKINKEDTTKET
jgi:hypothetical protein